MAQTVLTNAQIIYNHVNMSGDHNSVAVAVGCDALEDTAFGDTTRTHVGGLKTGAFEGRGWFNGGVNNDKAIFDRIGTADVPISVCESAGAAGDPCYFMQSTTSTFEFGGAVGDMLPFSLSAVASGGTPIVRGRVLFNGTVTADGSGTAVQAGAVSSTQKLYAALHQTGTVVGGGPTLVVTIESDNASNFPSPVTRATFTILSDTRGAQFITPVAGPFTDDWWRATFDISGTGGPGFPLVVVMGIL